MPRAAFELTSRVSEDLDYILDSGMSIATTRGAVIQAAIAVYKALIDEVKDGNKIQVAIRDSENIKEIILP